MVTECQSVPLSLSEAVVLRRQAETLLARLKADREQSERRSADTGKRDPMKFITGRTALDAAIASTQDIIRQMDSLLTTLQREFPESAPAQPQPQPRRRPRQLLRPHLKTQSVMSSNQTATVAVTP